ncbi:MAG: right-handed parallel beta-helix repeat-containing protein [Promethearchaeota archaeon]
MTDYIKKKNIFLAIFTIFIITIITLNFTPSLYKKSPYYEHKLRTNDEKETNINLKTAGYWKINRTHIKNNWSDVETGNPWCKGSGTWKDPYIIENITIDGNKSSCLIIENSRDYFIIKNCTLQNATNINHAAIVLNNVTNGTIISNYIEFNYNGILINSSTNLTVKDNKISSNNNHAIYLFSSNNNDIENNRARKNSGVGIYFYNSFYNEILNNGITNNDLDGIFLENSQHNHFIDNHLKINDQNGFYLKNSDYNNISYNIIDYNLLYGISIDKDSSYNIIKENYIGYNTEGCIEDKGKSNEIENNDCVGNYDEEPVYGDLGEDSLVNLDSMIYIFAGVIIGAVGLFIVAAIIHDKNLAKELEMTINKPSEKKKLKMDEKK